jgi:hypothetical protein
VLQLARAAGRLGLVQSLTRDQFSFYNLIQFQSREDLRTFSTKLAEIVNEINKILFNSATSEFDISEAEQVVKELIVPGLKTIKQYWPRAVYGDEIPSFLQ